MLGARDARAHGASGCGREGPGARVPPSARPGLAWASGRPPPGLQGPSGESRSRGAPREQQEGPGRTGASWGRGSLGAPCGRQTFGATEVDAWDVLFAEVAVASGTGSVRPQALIC